MRWLAIAAGGVLALYLAGLVGLFLVQRRLIYPVPVPARPIVPIGTRSVHYRTSDGLTLSGAYRPAQAGRATLVFFHGNGDNLAGADAATRSLGRAGYGILLVEYRGYGGNPGSPNEAGLYRDGRAALDWLGSQGVADRQIVLIGNSLGSGVAVEMATERDIGALVLVSPFVSLADAIRPHVPFVPVGLLLRDRFENLAKLGGRKLPVLVLHGKADRLIAASQGVAIAAATEGSDLVLVPDVGHELAYQPESQRRIAAWLDSHGR